MLTPDTNNSQESTSQASNKHAANSQGSNTPEYSKLWYPYAQMKSLELNLEVVEASGVYLTMSDGKRLIDGISSWWCVSHGYNHPELNQAMFDQAQKFSHVMLGGLKNSTTEAFASKLVEITPEGLNHVFFSDSGSVGVEVAIKMALQYFFNQGNQKKTRIVALERAYHGDTTACMSVCDPAEGMHKMFHGITPEQFFLPAPKGGFNASTETIDEELSKAETLFQTHGESIAAVIVEPLMQGAGGFNIYSPEYLNRLKALCEQHDILLIFDEVATGFGRTGKLFATNHTDIVPDIMVLAKGLTAGYVGHAATLASTKIFEAFLSDSYSKAFMHGPTFMGNPLACAIGLKAIEIFERDNFLGNIETIESILKEELLGFEHEEIVETRVLGATGAIEVKDAKFHQGIQQFAAERGVWIRPFERYIYTMPPFVITPEELRKITGVMKAWFARPR
ncbi:adenosylmethionine--8-amino-7-oxononanoate transaminase [Litoribrevibacter albus]|uniref:Adenosylmethionine-8-amino-7-oxononanoate aminotransferase n=1 Tax=Litoribrevibacter albus TaxID=1473156 RepID=A0AA37SA41_9GAMM|nr:adenosylmethionine--8-amino-7-oxononanoate transaminase [Litoribrevibacter albus]GLQ31269.1 adenosylmethionine-8-amino-7-oxononanoate aminotransferase [Litoribrevibacter albus]